MRSAMICFVLIAGRSFAQDALLQGAEAKLITSLRDLELGMPRDHVLAGLAGRYKLTEPEPPPDDPSKGWDIWEVFSGDVYAGEVLLKDGKLANATIRLYTTGDGGERELVDRLFSTLSDNSGQSTIDEMPAGGLTRETSTTIFLESVELNLGKHKSKTLKFLMPQRAGNSTIGQRLFLLSTTTGVDGNRAVTLDESIIKECQGQKGKN